MDVYYNQGTIHLLNVYLQNVAFAGPFYVGLGTGTPPPSLTGTLSDVDEVVGTGYARQPVTRSALATGWAVASSQGSSPVLTFTNSAVSVDDVWTDADYMFLTLSPSGTSSPNVLISVVELEDTFILAGGQSKDFIFRLGAGAS